MENILLITGNAAEQTIWFCDEATGMCFKVVPPLTEAELDEIFTALHPALG